MVVSFNRPRIGVAIAAWNVFCLLGLGLGAYMIVQSLPAEATAIHRSWGPGGLFMIGFAVAGLLVADLWHAAVQRTVEIRDDFIAVRRWIDVIRSRVGRQYAVPSVNLVQFLVVSGGAKIRIHAENETHTFSIWFWKMDEARGLAEALERRGVPTGWQLPFAPKL